MMVMHTVRLSFHLAVSIAILSSVRASDSETTVTLEDKASFFPDDFVQNYWEQNYLHLKNPWNEEIPHHKAWKAMLTLQDVDWLLYSGVAYKNETHQDGMIYQEDYVLAKVHQEEDGELWTRIQVVPESVMWSHHNATGNSQATWPVRPDILDVAHKSFENGYSLVLNGVNHRWPRVASFAHFLSKELFGSRVNTNMYLTPVGAKAFEPHFDWMESIIVQLAGRKLWKLYRTPHIRLSRTDQKYKPTSDEVGEPFLEFVMEPGDVLYIPSGLTHSCEAVESSVPSLHLTFGVEVDAQFLWEDVARRLVLQEQSLQNDPILFAGALIAVRAAANEFWELRRAVGLTEYTKVENLDECTAEDCTPPMSCTRAMNFVQEYLSAVDDLEADEAQERISSILSSIASLAQEALESMEVKDVSEAPKEIKKRVPTVLVLGFEVKDSEILQDILDIVRHPDAGPKLLVLVKDVLQLQDPVLSFQSVPFSSRCGAAIDDIQGFGEEALKESLQVQFANIKRHMESSKLRYKSWMDRMPTAT